MEFVGGTKNGTQQHVNLSQKKKKNPAGGALGNIFNRQKFRLRDIFTPLTLLCLRPFIHAEVKVKTIMCLLVFFMLQRFFTKVDVYKLSRFYYFFLISRKKLSLS